MNWPSRQGLDPEEVRRLVQDRAPESLWLDFKVGLSGWPLGSKEKRDILADITAFANHQGGTILIGIREEEGNATELVGLARPPADELILSFESLLRDSVEPSLGGRTSMSEIRISSERYILAIDVPPSPLAPHMVKSEENWRFYKRNSRGNHPMSVGELREAFLSSGAARDRARTFRDQRLRALFKRASSRTLEDTPVKLPGSPLVVLHLIPANSGQDLALDASVVRAALEGDLMFSRPFDEQVLNYDGVLLKTHQDSAGGVSRYLQLYRSGEAELVLSDCHRQKDSDHWLPSSYERFVIGITGAVISVYASLGFLFPAFASLSLLGFMGYRLLDESHEDFRQLDRRQIGRSLLVSDLAVIGDRSTDIRLAMRTPFTRVWNECNEPRSPNYPETGD